MLLYELARNGDAQDSARKEIASLVEPGQQPEAQHVKRMTYLKACIKETLRSAARAVSNCLLSKIEAWLARMRHGQTE